MRNLLLVVAAAALAGCGIETASTAATGAAIKKQEIEQGRKAQENAERRIEQATQQMQERAARAGDPAER